MTSISRGTPLEAFRESLGVNGPPPNRSAPIAALWWAGKKDWSRAHAIVQDADGREAAWVHAHLHRIEGDVGNASYWYRRAGQPVATGSLEGEWDAITSALLRA